MYTSDVDLRLISADLIKHLENPVDAFLPSSGLIRRTPHLRGHSSGLSVEPGLLVVIWLGWEFDPFQDLHHPYSLGFRSFQSSGHLGSQGTFLLYPYSRRMILHIVCNLWCSVPWLRSCKWSFWTSGRCTSLSLSALGWCAVYSFWSECIVPAL